MSPFESVTTATMGLSPLSAALSKCEFDDDHDNYDGCDHDNIGGIGSDLDDVGSDPDNGDGEDDGRAKMNESKINHKT